MLAKSGPIATKRKANILIELQASNVTNGSDVGHNLDLWILKVKHDLDLWPHTWPWPWIFLVKFLNSCISEWDGWLTLHKGGCSRSFVTMTIWWPRLGVWIYQIVTEVTSVAGMPSTHLVLNGTLKHMAVTLVTSHISGHVIPDSNLLPLALGRGSSGMELDFTYGNRDSPRMVSVYLDIFCMFIAASMIKNSHWRFQFTYNFSLIKKIWL